MHRLIERLQRHCPEYQRQLDNPRSRLREFILATPLDPHAPEQVFCRLRWGGVFAFASEQRRDVLDVARRLQGTGLILEEGPTYLRQHRLGLPIPLLSRKVHYLVARKVLLIPPGQYTERFTYDVRLVPHSDLAHPLVVLKEAPSFESVVDRLQKKFPDVAIDVIERRARKFVDRIFPTFLTREAAILMILEEHLPRPYGRRVPRVINVEKDDRGFVQKLWMNWLRNGGHPLTQLEFARQSADLLRAIHDVARVIHLDLRLDNFVITEEGVGFVDFGSAVRDDEKLDENPLLSSFFEELMRTSQIQRMLSQMTMSGHVTSKILCESRHKVDKAVDFFYLAVQFNSPHSNPDLADLIEYDPDSDEARNLKRLTAEILRPADPASPVYRSAKDILHGIERIQLRLNARRKR